MQDEATALERDQNGRWVAGMKTDRCLNPHGRPLGARTRLSDAFLKDLLRNWEAEGYGTIDAFRKERPNEYVKMVASLLPKHFNIKVNELDELTDEQLDRRIESLLAVVQAGASSGAGSEGLQEAPQPVALLPALSETA